MKRSPRNPESGFAVLMIYSMAAIVAIMLFMQIPRVAFEAQRDKEQLLIDRGEQYSRAIQLYVRKFNKYPADFDALDNTQNLRFLRRKYKDPMTGKDDWRIIHVGAGGVFTDSLIYNKKKDDKSSQSEPQNFITELQHTGGNQVDPNNQIVNVGTRQRQSDQPGAPGDPNNPSQPPQFDANGNPIQNPPVPGQVVFPGQQPGVSGFPGDPQLNANGTLTAPGQPFPGQSPANPAFPNQGSPNQGFPNQGFPNQGFPNQGFPNQGNNPYQTNQGLFGQQANPQQGGPPGGAASLINQLLTTPRPGGFNGMGGVQQDPNAQPTTAGNLPGPPGTPIPPAAGQTVIGGGIAGVASKLEEDGIKVYKEQSSYNKWEFVYDITKDPARTGANGMPAPGAQPNNNGQSPNGNAQNPGATPASGFGASGTTTSPNAPPASPQPSGATPQQP